MQKGNLKPSEDAPKKQKQKGALTVFRKIDSAKHNEKDIIPLLSPMRQSAQGTAVLIRYNDAFPADLAGTRGGGAEWRGGGETL